MDVEERHDVKAHVHTRLQLQCARNGLRANAHVGVSQGNNLGLTRRHTRVKHQGNVVETFERGPPVDLDQREPHGLEGRPQGADFEIMFECISATRAAVGKRFRAGQKTDACQTASSACSKSAIRSSGSSIPILIRTRLSEIPSSARRPSATER